MEINLGICMAEVETRRFSPADRANNCRIYVGAKDETVAENFLNRRNRPVEQWRFIVKLVMDKMGRSTKGLRWSQRAGCRCGCSPGFIAPYGPTRTSMFITVVGLPKTNGNGPSPERVAALDRAFEQARAS